MFFACGVSKPPSGPGRTGNYEQFCGHSRIFDQQRPFFQDQVTQSAQIARRCARARRNARVERVNIKAQMNRTVSLQVDMVERQLANAIVINLMHTRGLDAVFLQNLLLALSTSRKPM